MRHRKGVDPDRREVGRNIFLKRIRHGVNNHSGFIKSCSGFIWIFFKNQLSNFTEAMLRVVEKYLFYIYVCARVYGHHVYPGTLRGQKRVVRSPGTEVTDGCELPSGN